MMIEPICLEHEHWQVHPFGPRELNRHDALAREIYQLLSDQQTLRFLPGKRLRSVADAEDWLKMSILNFHCGKSYTHLITEKNSGLLTGVIDIIPPATSRKHYVLEQYPYFIEFYLRREAAGQNLMSSLLPLALKALAQQDIGQLAAVINRRNHAARKVLENSGFIYRAPFDALQDLYLAETGHDLADIRRAG
ncbi:GNAT family N-acetyltransferase [Mucilaginibacter celer]|uniref:GNAT family N-acetyltransferase n=1 Tax=Mucilaginibacter celer TaxID=2305508 RepID=A0A494VK43_9SPHI|nr:GNAT family N-acetyltransferase [Mucilaginibacter celer]AYL94289.1 GNAT family N-acetyltransferase [Mucilaginibacter celer]